MMMMMMKSVDHSLKTGSVDDGKGLVVEGNHFSNQLVVADCL